MKKIVTIVGARPQFIKAATVSRAVAGRNGLREVIVHTGQHYDANMSDIFFEEMAIPKPHYHLGIGSGSHGAMTGRQLEKIEEVLLEETPDWVLVYGDTNSTLAGALAAAKLHIPVAHIEAGLRSFNRRMPEEINRVLTDHVSAVLFAPTTTARANLIAEGIDPHTIHVVGDVMYDASLFYRSRARKPEWFDDYDLAEGEFVLCTIHRAENTDEPLRMTSILHGLAESDAPIILPLHPRTRKKLHDFGLETSSNIYVVEPVGYLEMTWLEAHCRSVATDSGGVQKEAYFSGKPCVTLRDETEWVELVTNGVNVLAGADAALITRHIRNAGGPLPTQQLYGAGDSAERIISILA
jgi:UDP-GlcNAc3NAcA epimerase